MTDEKKRSSSSLLDDGPVLQRLAEAPSVFCFLDFDGTLAPLAPTPEEATPLPGASNVLEALVLATGTKTAVVTGRAIEDVRRLLDVPGVIYVGVHGAETRFPNGAARSADGVAALRPVLESIRSELRDTLGDRPGILIEDKGAAVACHYRLADLVDGATARETAAQLVGLHERKGVPVRLQHGRRVVEILPSNIGKGPAVATLLATHGGACLPLYIGDDTSDEDAFAVLPAGSITIRVGPPHYRTRARYRLDSPADVLEFLRAMLRRRLGAAGPG